jgi:hypothetical protein
MQVKVHALLAMAAAAAAETAIPAGSSAAAGDA